MKSASKSTQDLPILFGKNEIELARGADFPNVKAWLTTQFSELIKCLTAEDYDRSHAIVQEVFITRREDFLRLLLYARSEFRFIELFLAEGLSLATKKKDYAVYDMVESVTPDDFINERIWLGRATFHAAVGSKSECLYNLKMALLCGARKNTVMSLPEFQPFVTDAEFQNILEEAERSSGKLEQAILQNDWATTKLMLSSFDTLSSFSFKDPTESRAYAIRSLAWHFCNHEDQENAREIMQLAITKTPRGIQGETLTSLWDGRRHLNVLSYLLDCGVDRNTPSRLDQKTAFARATELNNTKFIAHLKKIPCTDQKKENKTQKKAKSKKVQASTAAPCLSAKFFTSLQKSLIEIGDEQISAQLSQADWNAFGLTVYAAIVKHWKRINQNSKVPVGTIIAGWADNDDNGIDFDYEEANDPDEFYSNGVTENMEYLIVNFEDFYKQVLNENAVELRMKKHFSVIKDLLCKVTQEMITKSISETAFQAIKKTDPHYVVFYYWHDDDMIQLYSSED